MAVHTCRKDQCCVRVLFLAVLLQLCLVVICSRDDPHVPCSPWWRLTNTAIRRQTSAWFEGWYIRVTDSKTGDSFAGIVGHQAATNQSTIMILSCYSNGEKREGGANAATSDGFSEAGFDTQRRSLSTCEKDSAAATSGSGNQKDRKSLGNDRAEKMAEGSWIVNGEEKDGSELTAAVVIKINDYKDGRKEEGEEVADARVAADHGGNGECTQEAEHGLKTILLGSEDFAQVDDKHSCDRVHVTQAVFFATDGVKITSRGKPVTNNPDWSAPTEFEWKAENLNAGTYGALRKSANKTVIDLRVGGCTLKAELTNQVPWKKASPGAGPEGWIGWVQDYIPILQTRWFVSSLGSAAHYHYERSDELLSKSKGIEIQGAGWGHEEKNWGSNFPSGHVWGQAMTPDNDAQIVFTATYFKLFGMATPFIGGLGFRSPLIDLDIRSVDVGSLIYVRQSEPCNGSFALRAFSPYYSVDILFTARPSTFSEPYLTPSNKGTWSPECSASFRAVGEVVVWQHETILWGFVPLPWRSKVMERTVFKNAVLEFGEEMACTAMTGESAGRRTTPQTAEL